MILSVEVKNFKCFSEKVKIDFLGTKKTDRFLDNMYVKNDVFRVCKSACIYGPNNVGKSMLISAIETIVKTMEKEKADYQCNIPLATKGNDVCELGICFTVEDKQYSFDFKYSNRKTEALPKGFIYEKFQELTNMENASMTKEKRLTQGKLIYRKDLNGVKVGEGYDKKLEEILNNADNDAISILNVSDKYEDIKKWKDIFANFTNSVMIYRTYERSFTGQVDDLVNKYKEREGDREEITQILANVDAEIVDYKYSRPEIRDSEGNTIDDSPSNRQINKMADLFSLISFHKDFSAPSIAIDSRGTIQTAILATYIVDALKNNKTLIVDEIDNGLHFKVTKALINMFNNNTNYMGQMIVTTHDTNLLNVQTMFRKEQIWFIAQEDGKRYVYSLNDFTAEDGTRGDTNVEQRYKNGQYGAIPSPSLFRPMMEISEDRKNGKT